MSDKIPTLSQVIKQYQDRITKQGFHDVEAFEDVVNDLLYMLKQYRDAAKKWEKDCEKLRQKYEPRVAELS